MTAIVNPLSNSFAFSLEVIGYAKPLLESEWLKQVLSTLIQKQLKRGYFKGINPEFFNDSDTLTKINNALLNKVSDLAYSEAGKKQLDCLIKYHRKRDVSGFAESVLLRASLAICQQWQKKQGAYNACLP